MKFSHSLAAIFVAAILRFPGDAGELEFYFRAGFGDPKNRSISLRCGYDDSGGAGAEVVKRYERKPESISQDDKFEVFRCYLANLKFVQAERIAEQLASASNAQARARGAFALGMAKLCRGDYEGALVPLKSAELLGYRDAAYFRIYVSCLILERPADVEAEVNGMLRARELNKSSLAATAVLAFCLVAEDGEKRFDQVADQIKREILFSEQDVFQLYAGACVKYGRTKDLQALKREYESRKEQPPR